MESVMYWIVDIKSEAVAVKHGAVVKFSQVTEEDGKITCKLVSKDAKLVWDEWTFINAISCKMVKARRLFGYIIEDTVMTPEEAEEYCISTLGDSSYLKTLPTLINLI